MNDFFIGDSDALEAMAFDRAASQRRAIQEQQARIARLEAERHRTEQQRLAVEQERLKLAKQQNALQKTQQSFRKEILVYKDFLVENETYVQQQDEISPSNIFALVKCGVYLSLIDIIAKSDVFETFEDLNELKRIKKEADNCSLAFNKLGGSASFLAKLKHYLKRVEDECKSQIDYAEYKRVCDNARLELRNTRNKELSLDTLNDISRQARDLERSVKARAILIKEILEKSGVKAIHPSRIIKLTPLNTKTLEAFQIISTFFASVNNIDHEAANRIGELSEDVAARINDHTYHSEIAGHAKTGFAFLASFGSNLIGTSRVTEYLKTTAELSDEDMYSDIDYAPLVRLKPLAIYTHKHTAAPQIDKLWLADIVKINRLCRGHNTLRLKYYLINACLKSERSAMIYAFVTIVIFISSGFYLSQKSEAAIENKSKYIEYNNNILEAFSNAYRFVDASFHDEYEMLQNAKHQFDKVLLMSNDHVNAISVQASIMSTLSNAVSLARIKANPRLLITILEASREDILRAGMLPQPRIVLRDWSGLEVQSADGTSCSFVLDRGLYRITLDYGSDSNYWQAYDERFTVNWRGEKTVNIIPRAR